MLGSTLPPSYIPSPYLFIRLFRERVTLCRPGRLELMILLPPPTRAIIDISHHAYLLFLINRSGLYYLYVFITLIKSSPILF
jgi:hypothetical protein